MYSTNFGQESAGSYGMVAKAHFAESGPPGGSQPWWREKPLQGRSRSLNFIFITAADLGLRRALSLRQIRSKVLKSTRGTGGKLKVFPEASVELGVDSLSRTWHYDGSKSPTM